MRRRLAETALPVPPKAQLAALKAKGKSKVRKKIGKRLAKPGKMRKMARKLRLKRDVPVLNPDWVKAAAENFPAILPDLIPTLLTMPEKFARHLQTPR